MTTGITQGPEGVWNLVDEHGQLVHVRLMTRWDIVEEGEHQLAHVSEDALLCDKHALPTANSSPQRLKLDRCDVLLGAPVMSSSYTK